jgi:hypothetical protein
LNGDAWQATLHGFTESAWRLETLPAYDVPQEKERIAAFLRGERLPDDYESAWMRKIANHVCKGRTVGRVRILTRPLSDYLRLEFMHYRHHVRAGEDIRVLDVTGRENPLDGIQDFWMFDSARIVLMNYKSDGTQTGRELYEGDPAAYNEYRRIAIAESVQFEEYVKQFDARSDPAGAFEG